MSEGFQNRYPSSLIKMELFGTSGLFCRICVSEQKGHRNPGYIATNVCGNPQIAYIGIFLDEDIQGMAESPSPTYRIGLDNPLI